MPATRRCSPIPNTSELGGPRRGRSPICLTTRPLCINWRKPAASCHPRILTGRRRPFRRAALFLRSATQCRRVRVGRPSNLFDLRDLRVQFLHSGWRLRPHKGAREGAAKVRKSRSFLLPQAKQPVQAMHSQVVGLFGEDRRGIKENHVIAIF